MQWYIRSATDTEFWYYLQCFGSNISSILALLIKSGRDTANPSPTTAHGAVERLYSGCSPCRPVCGGQSRPRHWTRRLGLVTAVSVFGSCSAELVPKVPSRGRMEEEEWSQQVRTPKWSGRNSKKKQAKKQRKERNLAARGPIRTKQLEKVKQLVQGGASRTQVKSFLRKDGKRAKEKRRKREARSRQMHRLKKYSEALSKEKAIRKRKVKGGTWNVRSWGAPYTKHDPKLKTDCILSLLEAKEWEFAMFSDVKFPENCIREYTTNRQK